MYLRQNIQWVQSRVRGAGAKNRHYVNDQDSGVIDHTDADECEPEGGEAAAAEVTRAGRDVDDRDDDDCARISPCTSPPRSLQIKHKVHTALTHQYAACHAALCRDDHTSKFVMQSSSSRTCYSK